MRKFIALIISLFLVSPSFGAAGALRQQIMQPPGWVKQLSGHSLGIGIAADFANRRMWIQGSGQADFYTRLSTTRTTVKNCDYRSGTWINVPNNYLCLTDKGPLIEEARTNSVRNNSMQGAVVSAARNVGTISGISRTASAAAVVASTGHTVLLNDAITIVGASPAAYNGTYLVTAVTANVSYSYITSASATDSASGYAVTANSPGTPPTNWNVPSPSNGLSRQIVGFGTDSGIDYIDIRYAGIATSTNTTSIVPEATTQMTAAYGQTWTSSAFFSLVGGSFTNLTSASLAMAERDPNGGSLTSSSTSLLGITSADISTQRVSVSRTLLSFGTAFALNQWSFNYNNAAAVDFTMRYGWPQAENNSIATGVTGVTANGITGAVQATGGSTCTNGVQTFTGTLGTGTKATYLGTVSGNALAAGALTVLTVGSYSVNPGVDTLSGGGCGVAPTATTTSGGGTGYGAAATGTLTWSGAGCTTNPVINVTSNAGGAIVTVNSITTAGSCTTFPSSVATTWTAGGGLSAGSGAALGLTPVGQGANAFATSPIRTTSAAVTRNADVVTVTNPPTFGAAYSIYASGTPNAPAGYSIQQFALTLGAGDTNRLTMQHTASTGTASTNSISGGVSTTLVGAGWTTGISGKIAAADAQGDQAMSFNAGTVLTGAGNLPVGVSTINIGKDTGSSRLWDGYITAFGIWTSTRLPNAALQQVTSGP